MILTLFITLRYSIDMGESPVKIIQELKQDAVCQNTTFEGFQAVMIFLLLNHALGRPKDSKHVCLIIFGFAAINMVTFF